METALEFDDIAIAGGGPAGSVAAILLARAGFRVGLATSLPVQQRIEGLSPRVLSILRANHLSLAGVGEANQRRAHWGAIKGDQNVEHLVDRKAFDRGLLDQARREGVTITQGTIASVDANTGVIKMADGHRILAGLLFDARGRRAPRMRVANRRKEMIGPETISIAGVVEPTGNIAGSEIVARPEGWTWRARLKDGREWLQVVADAAIVQKSRGAKARRDSLWHHVLGDDVSPPRHPCLSAAGLRLNAPEFDPQCLRLGDAAVALDPLSGHGLFWAVSSALMAVPMAKALFGGRTDLARDFYLDRVIDTFWRQARIGRDFYLSSGQTGEFWQRRCSWPDKIPAHPVLETPRLEQRVLLRNGKLARGEVLVTNADPGGAAFVFGQEIAPLLRAVGDRPIPDVQTFHETYLPGFPVSLTQQLHGWLITRGLGHGPAVISKGFEEENAPCETTQAV